MSYNSKSFKPLPSPSASVWHLLLYSPYSWFSDASNCSKPNNNLHWFLKRDHTLTDMHIAHTHGRRRRHKTDCVLIVKSFPKSAIEWVFNFPISGSTAAVYRLSSFLVVTEQTAPRVGIRYRLSYQPCISCLPIVGTCSGAVGSYHIYSLFYLFCPPRSAPLVDTLRWEFTALFSGRSASSARAKTSFTSISLKLLLTRDWSGCLL